MGGGWGWSKWEGERENRRGKWEGGREGRGEEETKMKQRVKMEAGDKRIEREGRCKV